MSGSRKIAPRVALVAAILAVAFIVVLVVASPDSQTDAKLRDDNGAISVAFGVARVPETWIIDPNGFVRLRIAGKLTEGLLDEQLALLKGQS
ncbi:MAG: hypothetical protein EBZ55_01530 [Actinobacteria bacterium]|nr:hypothetical protein [Actinomycetota bacterium]